LPRLFQAAGRKIRRFYQLGAARGYKVAAGRAVLSLKYRLRAAAQAKLAYVSPSDLADAVRQSVETSQQSLAPLQRSLNQCEESIRHHQDVIRQQQEAIGQHLEAIMQHQTTLRQHDESIQRYQAYVGQCQDSIRQLTTLLTAAVTGPSMAAGPKISVIMPVYNRADLIPAAIRSVLAQEGVNFELIVVDDGSTDELTSSTIPELENKMVRLLRLPHQGPCVARNQGIAASTGEIIAYLDSDNCMYPGYLRALAATYAGQADAACGYAALLWDDCRSSVHLRHDEFSWGLFLLQRVNVDMNCFSHRKCVWETLGGFDENLTRHGDFDLALRYLRVHQPMRIAAVAAWYCASDTFSRITLDELSEPNLAYIHAKQKRIAGRKPRVLLVCWDYPQRSESYIYTEIACFLRQGYEIEVHSQAEPGSRGIAQVKMHRGALQQAIDEFQPDLLHAHWLTTGLAAAPIAQRAGLPLTVRGHGFEFSPALLESCLAHEAVTAVYVFPHFMEELPEQHHKLRAVTSAFDTKRFSPRRQRDPKLVLRAGACLPTKGIEMFFEMAIRCPEFTFVLAMVSIATEPALPEKLRALNRSLGNPVDLRFDVQHDDMEELVAEAGIYVHTFGFVEPFGMPVSIIESLACGALVLARDCPEARDYAGPHSLYYSTADEAAALINATCGWSKSAWQEQARQSVAFAQRYADDAVLAAITDDWREIWREAPPLLAVTVQARPVQTETVEAEAVQF
jgi:glycosyltransferase involved in cell wall biosynthesis